MPIKSCLRIKLKKSIRINAVDEYMEVYENIFKNSKIKWNIIPADQKLYRDYLVAKVILEKMKSFKMKYPKDINV